MLRHGSRILFVCGFALTVVACSSKRPVEEPKSEKPLQFKVIESATGGRESWLDSPQAWAKAKDFDVKTYHFYVGEGRSPDKRMACEKARIDVSDNVARRVAAFVDSSVGRVSNGVDSRTQLSKAVVNDMRIEEQYWERRDYSEAAGAKSVYLCWIMAAVQKNEVKSLVAKAGTLRLQELGFKEKMGDKLKSLSEQYDAYQSEHQ